MQEKLKVLIIIKEIIIEMNTLDNLIDKACTFIKNDNKKLELKRPNVNIIIFLFKILNNF